MKNRNYKLIPVHSICSICPNEYWQQLRENSENRYQNNSNQRR
ncbi:MAG: hypothetical protein PF513_06995 [Tenericutes bacterium]|jgi:hypothetical protein|nr:hypothetical protein [Mycoplasmatota bacterium]